jgi:hypothetical protein
MTALSFGQISRLLSLYKANPALPVAQAATDLGVGRDTVRKWVKLLGIYTTCKPGRPRKGFELTLTSDQINSHLRRREKELRHQRQAYWCALLRRNPDARQVYAGQGVTLVVHHGRVVMGDPAYAARVMEARR